MPNLEYLNSRLDTLARSREETAIITRPTKSVSKNDANCPFDSLVEDTRNLGTRLAKMFDRSVYRELASKTCANTIAGTLILDSFNF